MSHFIVPLAVFKKMFPYAFAVCMFFELLVNGYI